jgi:peptidoglycan/LPS O-acetylase OafA/YrhL
MFYNNYLDANKLLHNIAMFFCDLYGNGTTYILIGSLSAILIFENNSLISRLFINNYFASIIVAFAFLIRHPLSYLYLSYWSGTIFAICTSVFIIININNSLFVFKLLNNRIMVRIGVLSYSIYIWQQMFTGEVHPWSTAFEYGNFKLLNVGLLIIVSNLSYYFFEKKFLNIKEKFKSIP